MKKHYNIITILFLSFSASAQTINIPDVNLKMKLLEASTTNFIAIDKLGNSMNIDNNGNGEIEVSESVLVRELRVTNSSINSMVGIEEFTNLYSLDFSYNQVNKFDTSIFPNLFLLYCSNNNLTTLDLTNNLALQNLDCSHNLIDQVVLPNFTDGITANISFNKLTRIDLSNLSQIVSLDLNHNNLTSIIFNNPNYTFLVDGGIDVSNNPLITLDMSQLRNSTSLTEPYDNISINNTLLRQIICPQAYVKYYYISNNSNLELISFKNQLLENFVDNNFDTSIDIQKNTNLNTICVDDLEGISKTEQQFFENYFITSSVKVSTTKCTLSIEDDKFLTLFEVYPNPTTGLLNIVVHNNELINKLTVDNVLGQTILCRENNSIIDLSSLSKGFYFISVETDFGKKTKRIFKQ